MRHKLDFAKSVFIWVLLNELLSCERRLMSTMRVKRNDWGYVSKGWLVWLPNQNSNVTV